MVGVGVGVDHILHAETVLRAQPAIVIDLAEFWVDQRGRAGLFAADEVRLTPAGRHLFEDHPLAHPVRKDVCPWGFMATL